MNPLQRISLVLILLTTSPAEARFLTPDPVKPDPNTGKNYNRYWYADNNPIKYTDPDGKCPADSTKKTCIQSSVTPTNNKTAMVSKEASAAANSGKAAVMVPKGSTKEKLGSVNRQDSGELKVELVANATTKTVSDAYTASGTIPTNAEAIIHGHLAESGLMDQKGSLGDAGALASSGKPNIAVGADGRMAAHELENGSYQVRAISGVFTKSEIKHFQNQVDSRQEVFNDKDD